MHRRWRTPAHFKTPKTPGMNELSFMSIEENEDQAENEINNEQDETVVRVTIHSPQDEKKRKQNSPTTVDLKTRKRIRLAKITTIKKKTVVKENDSAVKKPQDSSKITGKRLDFTEQPQAKFTTSPAKMSNKPKSSLVFRMERFKKLEDFERKWRDATAEQLRQIFFEISEFKQEESDEVMLERINQLLAFIQHQIKEYEYAEIIKNKGTTFYQAQRYLEAERCYAEAIKLEPKRATHYSNHAATLIMLGEFQQAILDCDIATKIDPLFVRAYLRSARAFFSLGDYVNTSERLNRVLSLKEKAIQFNLKADLFSEAEEMIHQVNSFVELIEQGDAALLDESPEISMKKAHSCLEIFPHSIHARCLEVISNLLLSVLDSNKDLYKHTLTKLEAHFGKNEAIFVQKYAKVLWELGYPEIASCLTLFALKFHPNDKKLIEFHKLALSTSTSLREAKRLQEEKQFEQAINFCLEALCYCPMHALLNSKIISHIRCNSYLQ